jgi:hypothetical protein
MRLERYSELFVDEPDEDEAVLRWAASSLDGLKLTDGVPEGGYQLYRVYWALSRAGASLPLPETELRPEHPVMLAGLARDALARREAAGG